MLGNLDGLHDLMGFAVHEGQGSARHGSVGQRLSWGPWRPNVGKLWPRLAPDGKCPGSVEPADAAGRRTQRNCLHMHLLDVLEHTDPQLVIRCEYQTARLAFEKQLSSVADLW